jgi:hypothetical protein
MVAGLVGGKTAGLKATVSPAPTPARHWRSEPAPLSAVLVTVHVAAGSNAAATPAASLAFPCAGAAIAPDAARANANTPTQTRPDERKERGFMGLLLFWSGRPPGSAANTSNTRCGSKRKQSERGEQPASLSVEHSDLSNSSLQG